MLPETALPLSCTRCRPTISTALAAHARSNGGDVLFGVPERTQHARVLQQRGVVRHRAAADAIANRTSCRSASSSRCDPCSAGFSTSCDSAARFRARRADQQPLEVAGQRVAVDICYEDVFGAEIIRQLPQATLLVNVSNVAWFGRSIAPRQHLQISQMRALETGRYMLRATNTGMTAIIDQRGRVEVTALEAARAVRRSARPRASRVTTALCRAMRALIAVRAMARTPAP